MRLHADAHDGEFRDVFVDGDLAAAIENNRRGSELAMLLLYLAVAVFILQSILARYYTNKISRDDVPDLTATLQSSRVAAARRS